MSTTSSGLAPDMSLGHVCGVGAGEIEGSFQISRLEDVSVGDEREIAPGIWATFHADREPTVRGPWTGTMCKPLLEWLDRVVQLLLRDFNHPTAISVRVGYGADHDGRNMLWIQEPDDQGPCGFQITDGMRGDDLIVELADALQEQFFLETSQAWGEPRPPCPAHPHPLSASTHDGTPYWSCPAGNRPIAPIGRLNAQAAMPDP
jgi:hypothetical protein